MISHQNVIANVLQLRAFEKNYRDEWKVKTEVGLGLLPLSHIYGLVVVAQGTTYRGDEVIVLPKFDLQSFLKSIQTFKINGLYLVSILRIECPQVTSSLLSGPSNCYSNGKKSIHMLEI